MNIVVIGSGISAIIVAKTFLEYNHKVSLVDY
jgi:UDP-galactopyranose mutase